MVASLLDVPDHIQCPHNVELKVSQVDDSRIGAFCLWPIAKGTEFGPFKGRIVCDKDDASVDPSYSWEVFDLETLQYLHTVDATNPRLGTWMRYVCCARYFEEQNIVSTQHGEEVYYKALKHIKPGDELLTWYIPKKKKKKRSSIQQSMESTVENPHAEPLHEDTSRPSSPAKSPEKMKRKRKPKIIPDSYDGPLELDLKTPVSKTQPKLSDDFFEPLQPGQKRRRRKKLSLDGADSASTSKATTPDTENTESAFFYDSVKSIKLEKSSPVKEENRANSDKEENTNQEVKKDDKKETGHNLSISEINNSVKWTFPLRGDEYVFELKDYHVIQQLGKKVYKCDICLGLYKHMFSLKRHYLRNHINYKYLSKADMTNCLINLAQVVQNINERSSPNSDGKKRKPKAGGNVEEKEVVEGEVKEGEDDVFKDADNMSEVKSRDENDIKNNEIKEESKNANDVPGGNKLEMDNERIANATNAAAADKSDDIHDSNSVDSDKPLTPLRTMETSENKVEEDNQENYNNLVDKTLCNGDNDDMSTIDSAENDSKMSLDETGSPKEDASSCNEKDENTSDSISDQNKVSSVENSPSMPGLFQCYTCYDLFDDLDSICQHVQNHPEAAEGTCFSCDQCNMRFNYKQNLVRHKKVHENDGIETGPVKKAKPTLKPVAKKAAETIPEKPSNGRDIDAETACVDKYREYRCGKCRVKFESLQTMMKHVQAEHKTGGKYQCQYCGKDFPSLPNMKKHVRFHLGYRVSCRFCTEVFPNVGCLRKHTRIFHPDIYKAKQLDKIARDGVLRRPDKKSKADDDTNKKPSLSHTKVRINEKVKTNSETVKNEVSCNEYLGFSDHEISFAAEEIDDGGSRFKFSCTVCKKRFSNYINMCRHRRRTHSHDSKHKSEESLTFGRKDRNVSPPILEDPAEVASFYANVSHNIATNLNGYIDGKPESLEKFVDHIKIEDYKGNFGYKEEEDKPVDLTWERYNFPRNYKPAKTISFAEIKNDLDIHNDFDSHCTSVDICDTGAAESNAGSVVNSSGDKSEEKTAVAVETVNSVVNGSGDKGEVCDNLTAMGKSSTGMTALASVVFPRAHKNTNNMKAENKFLNLKISDGMIMEYPSPASKNFNQVINGEYANFEDDLLPSDVDSPVIERTQSVTSAKSWAARNRQRKEQKSGEIVSRHSSVSDEDQVEPDTEKLERTAQEEISALYQSIDNHAYDRNVKRKAQSPKPLSYLCERILGLRPFTKTENKKQENCNEISSECPLFNKLSLSANQNGRDLQSTNERKETVPDYSDAPDGSPFYNYESIAFGKNGQITSVCAICKKHFRDFESLLRHHWKKHPASVCNFLEVEQGHEIEALHFTEPSNVGALAVTDPGLDNIDDMECFTCTLCGCTFKTVAKLHAHIVNCAPIDPVSEASKTEKSPSKTTFRKKIQRKFQHMFNMKEHSYKLKLMGLNGTPKEEIKSQKRVFTGCRKRTSVILPDSPVKLTAGQRLGQEVTTGYNPHNHIRRRELTRLVDTLTCEGCGLKFKTIILLERHVKHCTKKERFKNVRPMTCPILDESLAKLKNVCFYCNKHFTYMKSLLNHFQDFCLIKKSKLLKGELTEDEKQKEEEIIERLLKQEDEKVSKDKEIESSVKRKQSWQVGRKPKRKGHAWTYIKKKKPSLISADGLDNDVDSEIMIDDDFDNEVLENGSDDSINDSLKSLSEISESLDDIEDDDDLPQNVSHINKNGENNLLSNGRGRKRENGLVDEHCESVDSGTKTDGKEAMRGFDEVDSASEVSELQKYLQNDIRTNSEVLDPAEFDNKTKGGKLYKSVEVVRTKASTVGDCDVRESSEEQMAVRGEAANNTSLNCTSRYRVNEIKMPKDSKCVKVSKGGSGLKQKTSLVFQCISNQIGDTGHKLEPIVNPEKDKTVECLDTEIGSQIIRSKRKRERVSKVEEFLRSTLKRKRKKKEDANSIKEVKNLEDTNSIREKEKNNEDINSIIEVKNLVSADTVKEVSSSSGNQDKPKKLGRPFGSKNMKSKLNNLKSPKKTATSLGLEMDSVMKDRLIESEKSVSIKSELKLSPDKSNLEKHKKRGRPRKDPMKNEIKKELKSTPLRKPGRPAKIKLQGVGQPRLSPKVEDSKTEVFENEGNELTVISLAPEIKSTGGLMENNKQCAPTDSVNIENDLEKDLNVDINYMDILKQKDDDATQGKSDKINKYIETTSGHVAVPCEVTSLLSNVEEAVEANKKIDKVMESNFEEIMFKKEETITFEKEVITEKNLVSEKKEVESICTEGVFPKLPLHGATLVIDTKEGDNKTIAVSGKDDDLLKTETVVNTENECIAAMGCLLTENETYKLTKNDCVDSKNILIATSIEMDSVIHENIKLHNNDFVGSDMEEDFVAVIDAVGNEKADEIEQKDQTSYIDKSCDNDVEFFEGSDVFVNKTKQDSCEDLNEKHVYMIDSHVNEKESESTGHKSNKASAKSEVEILENMNKSSYETIEHKSNKRSETSELEQIENTNKSPQATVSEVKYEMVLSPSERVKMNKRNCKKDLDRFSPVWVKQAKKTIPKMDNDITETFNDKPVHQTGRKPLFKKRKDEKMENVVVSNGSYESDAMEKDDHKHISATKELKLMINERRRSGKSNIEFDNKSINCSSSVEIKNSCDPKDNRLASSNISTTKETQRDERQTVAKQDNNPKGAKRKITESDSNSQTNTKLSRKDSGSSKTKGIDQSRNKDTQSSSISKDVKIQQETGRTSKKSDVGKSNRSVKSK